MEERRASDTHEVQVNVVVCKDPDEVAARAAAEFARIAAESISERGVLSVCLSGGSTPLLLYRHLLDTAVDWEKTFFFFGDERDVPADDDASNFRGANNELFRPLRIREDRIFRWRTELEDRDKAAADYERRLKETFAGFDGSEGVRFDLVFLGLGADGHTASLFPGTKALEESEKLAVANHVPRLDTWRYTLTYPVLNNSRNVIFLVGGIEKAEVFPEVLSGADLPAAAIKPHSGDLTWLADNDAASRLPAQDV